MNELDRCVDIGDAAFLGPNERFAGDRSEGIQQPGIRDPIRQNLRRDHVGTLGA